MATINGSITLIALPDIFRGIRANPLLPGNASLPHYRQELSEGFCRRQQRLLARRAIRTRAAAWQEGSVTQLRRFWKELGQPVKGAELEPDDTGETRLRDRRRESRGGAKRSG
jgi:hypothetical protein